MRVTTATRSVSFTSAVLHPTARRRRTPELRSRLLQWRSSSESFTPSIRRRLSKVTATSRVWPRPAPASIARRGGRVSEPSKTCNRCHVRKPVTEFYRRPNGSPVAGCRVCCATERRLEYQTSAARRAQISRAARLKRYGLTDADIAAMRSRQDGKCLVCEHPLAGGKSEHIDHCHTSGRVRGILCHRCNTGIGLFREDPVIFARAVAYLSQGEHDGTRPK